MHCYKLNDMLILRKMKNKEKLESILELDSNPLGGPSSRTGSGTNKTGSESKPDPEPFFRNGSGSTIVPIQNHSVCNPSCIDV